MTYLSLTVKTSNINQFQINYYTGIDETTITLSLPNCTETCPLQTLLDTVFELIPQNPHTLCGWTVENSTEAENATSLTPKELSGRGGSALYKNERLISNLILLYLAIWYLK